MTMTKPIEEGNPELDAKAFRRCLGQYPTGVCVVTTTHRQQWVGMAVNSLTAVSLDPPLVLWSIRRESRSVESFLEAPSFAISVLAQHQWDISRRFGGAQTDRFAGDPWACGRSGAPLLDGALAHLECERSAVHAGGDHWILIGRVLRCARFEGQPLVFSQGRYALTQDHPALGAAQAAMPSPRGGTPVPQSMAHPAAADACAA